MSVCEYHKKDKIFHIKNVISEECCEYLTKTIDCYKKYGKKLDHGGDNNIKSDVIGIHTIKDDNIKFNCHEIIHETLKVILSTLPKDVSHLKSSSYVEEVELRKIWGETREHADGPFGGSVPHPRVLSVIVALNSDYDGGELCFPEHDFKIKLKAGEALLFPPYWTHPHYTNVLKNNTYRYTITTWFCE